MDFKQYIREVADFPEPGIGFKDITTLLQDGPVFRAAIKEILTQLPEGSVDVVVGPESRGFLIGAPLAYELGAGFVPVRKPGKLPYKTVDQAYSLEYGEDRLEIHEDAILPGQRVLIADDLLATGGTTAATVSLVQKLGGEVTGLAFLIELTFLHGRNKLPEYPIVSLVQY